jgi:type II secretory pathway pseudopilin PulG
MMTLGQMIVAIVVAIIGASAGAFTFLQFMIKRKDEKEEKFSHEAIQKQIDESIDKAMGHFISMCGEIGDEQIDKAIKQAKEEFNEGLTMRGEEGKERFEINSKQISENTSMIKEVLEIQKQTNEKFDRLAESMTVLNEATTATSKLTRACAEGVRSTNYDKMLVVAKKALKRGAITISEKTNLKQLYNSYKELQGEDARIATYYDDCIKLPSIPDEEDE